MTDLFHNPNNAAGVARFQSSLKQAICGGSTTRIMLPALRVDAQGYLQEGRCACPWISQHELWRGPCQHLLALRSSVNSGGFAGLSENFTVLFSAWQRTYTEKGV